MTGNLLPIKRRPAGCAVSSQKACFHLCFLLWVQTHSWLPQEFLRPKNSHLYRALMVIQNTPKHVLQSTVLERAHAFIELARGPETGPEEMEDFYNHLRGNITSNHFLECAFHPELASVLQTLNTISAFQHIPHSPLKTWTRAGPNNCHAAGVSLYFVCTANLINTHFPRYGLLCCHSV